MDPCLDNAGMTCGLKIAGMTSLENAGDPANRMTYGLDNVWMTGVHRANEK